MSCICQRCGAPYKVDILVSDDLWDRIKPFDKPTGGGLLCGACICRRIEALGEYGALHLSDEPQPDGITTAKG